MTIVQAIKQAMKLHGKPCDANDAYDLIVKHGLYTFNSKDPVGVVRNQLRRHCVGIDLPRVKAAKHFKRTEEGKFVPISITNAVS